MEDHRLLLAKLEDILDNFEKKFYRPPTHDEHRELEAVIHHLRAVVEDEEQRGKQAAD